MQYIRRKSTRDIFKKQAKLAAGLVKDLPDLIKSAAEEYQAVQDYKERLKRAEDEDFRAALKEAIKDEEHHYQNFLSIIKDLTGKQDIEPADLPKMAAAQELGGGHPLHGTSKNFDEPSATIAAGVGRSGGQSLTDGPSGQSGSLGLNPENPDIDNEIKEYREKLRRKRSQEDED